MRAETAPPDWLLAQAKKLMTRSDARAQGVWPRAAAHLTRQALEESLRRFWADRAPKLADVSMKAQLACLPEYFADTDLAGRLRVTWGRLSEACHHHAYELAPTVGELGRWIEVVSAFDARPVPP